MQKVKKILLILIVMIGFGMSVNAQNVLSSGWTSDFSATFVLKNSRGEIVAEVYLVQYGGTVDALSHLDKGYWVDSDYTVEMNIKKHCHMRIQFQDECTNSANKQIIHATTTVEGYGVGSADTDLQPGEHHRRYHISKRVITNTSGRMTTYTFIPSEWGVWLVTSD